MGACALTRKVHATPFLLHCCVYMVFCTLAAKLIQGKMHRGSID